MRKYEKYFLLAWLFLSFCLILPYPAQAYIGPGAGFAFLTSFLVLFITFLSALFYLISAPFRSLFRAFRKKKFYAKSQAERLIIVGLDGMDPGLAQKYIAEGKMPNFARLQQMGCFKKLLTTNPSISPVAWSSFSTGTNPGKHNIFDFLSRDTRTYLPDLSSARIRNPVKNLPLGKYLIPLSKPEITLLRKSTPFWVHLGKKGIFSTILRVPITFPPDKFNGMQLSAMCVPDLKGTQGTFSFYTTDHDKAQRYTGGVAIPVALQSNRIESFLYGPENSLLKNPEELKIPFSIILNSAHDEVDIELQGKSISLIKGIYSDWIPVTFRAGLGIKVRGICRFLVTQTEPHFELYVTPLNIDPDKPALPISHPFTYAIYLSKLLGRYATLGLAEDTWALNEGIIDDKAFMEQTYMIHEEREKQFFNALDLTRRGVCACVFDTTDRIQHMYWRFHEDNHPALRGRDRSTFRYAIDELYQRMDNLVGRVMEKLKENDVLIVMSDHGFKSFSRGVNVNSWLYKNGYLSLKNGDRSGEWFRDVDWEKTKAYAMGLGGLYLNLKGRESKGIINPGEEAKKLKQELVKKLSGLKDSKTGQVAINQAYDGDDIFYGPYKENAPDMIIGYNEGYRASWDSVTGKVTEIIFEDNTKCWSGDHCIDTKVVPGILFCNRKIEKDNPHITDVAPTALKIFGVDIPAYVDGKPLF
jgi:predicted AlkP superfamily phosphohydrolase/phosphomutase